ncbi:hypothetical protein MNAN1_003792 [Malassezia nana]|uniref:COP9 signalosome complex subunit 4 n=1 Tax=Malassezia nana TaxID=180528 RepID=A0AAF0J494_9BASI|nr:hypothetical protein MNAN1_003792 [Malassezia nana]
MEVDARLAQIALVSSGAERLAAYAAVLNDVLDARPVSALTEGLVAYVRGAVLHRVNTAGAGLLMARRLVPELLEKLIQAHEAIEHPLHSAEVLCDAVLPPILSLLEAHAALWDDELLGWRRWHAQLLEQLERYGDAARVLQTVTPESMRGERNASWPSLCVKVVQLCMAAGDEDAAAHALKCATAALHTARDDVALQHDFSVCQAHWLALQRRFNDAAQRCLELSASTRFSPKEQGHMAQLAALHALAASPSTARTTLLQRLAQDERAASWPFCEALQRASRGQVLRDADTQALEGAWHACHRTPARYGLSAAALALSEHTLCALARSFSVVPIARLSAHVQLEESVCEKMVARLVAQGQFPPGSYVDQVQGVVRRHWRR